MATLRLPQSKMMGNPTVTPLHENWHDGGFLVSEANGHQSRDEIILLAGGQVLAGSVLGQVTATGLWQPWSPGAADGSEIAAGLLFGTRGASPVNQPAVAITRMAEVNASELVWPAGVQSADMATATAQLLTHGIMLR